MLIFGLRSTSDDWLGWSMDSNPICHPSPTKKMKCSFLDYVQLLMIGHQPLSSQKNEILIFGLHSTFDFQLGWLMDWNPICPLQYKESWILSELQIFQSFPTEVARNGQFCPICNFSNLFPLKWLR